MDSRNICGNPVYIISVGTRSGTNRKMRTTYAGRCECAKRQGTPRGGSATCARSCRWADHKKNHDMDCRNIGESPVYVISVDTRSGTNRKMRATYARRCGKTRPAASG